MNQKNYEIIKNLNKFIDWYAEHNIQFFYDKYISQQTEDEMEHQFYEIYISYIDQNGEPIDSDTIIFDVTEDKFDSVFTDNIKDDELNQSYKVWLRKEKLQRITNADRYNKGID